MVGIVDAIVQSAIFGIGGDCDAFTRATTAYGLHADTHKSATCFNVVCLGSMNDSVGMFKCYNSLIVITKYPRYDSHHVTNNSTGFVM